MFWFKKKIFLIEWSYECNDVYRYTEFIKAKSWYDAWQKVRRQHSIPIFCKTIKDVTDSGKIF